LHVVRVSIFRQNFGKHLVQCRGNVRNRLCECSLTRLGYPRTAVDDPKRNRVYRSSQDVLDGGLVHWIDAFHELSHHFSLREATYDGTVRLSDLRSRLALVVELVRDHSLDVQMLEPRKVISFAVAGDDDTCRTPAEGCAREELQHISAYSAGRRR